MGGLDWDPLASRCLMAVRSVFVQFGPQSTKQRCSVDVGSLNQLGVADRRVAEFMFLFEILAQLDITKIAFVDHLDALDANAAVSSFDPSGESDDDMLDGLLAGLARFAPHFTQRCLWRAFGSGNVSIGLWEEDSHSFMPIQSFDKLTDGSVVILAVPTSEDVSSVDIDESLTQSVIDEVFDRDPQCVFECILAFVRCSHSERLDDAGVQQVLRHMFDELSPQGIAWPFKCVGASVRNITDVDDECASPPDTLPALAGSSPGSPWSSYPRKLPPSATHVPVYPAPVLPAPQVSVPLCPSTEFDALFKAGGSQTLATVGISHVTPTDCEYSNPATIRIVPSQMVIGFLRRHFPFLDHGDGRGFDTALASAYQRPFRDGAGRIVAGYQEPPPVGRRDAAVKEFVVPRVASTPSELGSLSFTRAASERRAAAEDAAASAARAARRLPPPFPFLTEQEFLMLMSRIESM